MKIAWFCIPAHGHTNPTLGLVRELSSRGHEIRYFSFEQFREKIEAAGARFVSCDGFGFEMEDKGSADRVGKDIAYAAELLVSSTLALDDTVSAMISEFKPDVIVSDSVAYWGKLAAVKYGIPYVSSTTTFAFNRYSAAYMRRGGLGGLKSLLSMPKANRQIARLREHGYPVKSILEIISNDNDTNTIVYTSRLFQPRSETFSERYRFIGPSMRPVSAPMEKTAEKTVYVSMGTVINRSEIFKSCVEALAPTGRQIIISTGANDLEPGIQAPNVSVFRSVDQMAALSISDAFITHCGMNSASEALYYGVPLVLFPQTAEQGAVAKRVEELGAGVMLRSSAPADIRCAVETVLGDDRYREAALRISESFKACGGVREAADFIEECGRRV
jgi:MGT family glycosyltransferase